MSRRQGGLQGERLTVDPIGCQGHGLCAELLPERVTLDEWGYPLLAAGELPPELHRAARRAVAACPARALQLSRAADSAPVQTLPGQLTGNPQGGTGQWTP